MPSRSETRPAALCSSAPAPAPTPPRATPAWDPRYGVNYIAAGHGLPNNGRPARFKRGKPNRGGF